MAPERLVAEVTGARRGLLVHGAVADRAMRDAKRSEDRPRRSRALQLGQLLFRAFKMGGQPDAFVALPNCQYELRTLGTRGVQLNAERSKFRGPLLVLCRDSLFAARRSSQHGGVPPYRAAVPGTRPAPLRLRGLRVNPALTSSTWTSSRDVRQSSLEVFLLELEPGLNLPGFLRAWRRPRRTRLARRREELQEYGELVRIVLLQG